MSCRRDEHVARLEIAMDESGANVRRRARRRFGWPLQDVANRHGLAPILEDSVAPSTSSIAMK